MIRKYGKSFIRYLTILILILIQIVFLFVLANYLQNKALFAYLLIEVFSLMIMIPLLSDSRNASYKLYWMSIILILPIVGHIMYQLWGKNKINKKEHRQIQEIVNESNKHQVFQNELLKVLEEEDYGKWKISNYLFRQGYPPYDHTEMEYFPLGELAFADMEKELLKAKKFICMSFFTMADGVILKRICEITEQKVKEGVRVMVLYDDAGSVFQLADDTVEMLQKAGVKICRFNPVERSYHHLFLNYRNHQKIVVVDGVVAYTGGINASDRYANIKSPYGHWKDIAVKMKGDAAYSMTLMFLGMWNASGNHEDYELYKPASMLESQAKEKRDTMFCQPFADGPSNNPENESLDIYMHMIQEANKEVFITTPYLIIDDTLRDTLCLAAKSGVDVRIITPGIPDKKRTKRLTEWNYGTLLQAGVRIYEYTPGFMHAKMIINEFSSVVGTINMDFRSFFLHYESAVWTPQKQITKTLRQDFMEVLKQCREIHYDEWKERPFLVKVQQYVLQVFKCQF